MKLYVWMVVCPFIGIIVFSLLSKKFSEKAAFFVTAAIFFAMLASGTAKQIVALCTGYNLWYLPLHFSSTFYLTVALVVFARGKARHAAQAVLFAGGVIMAVMILANPAAILGNLDEAFTSHIHAHGYFYHMFVMAEFGILVARGRYFPKKTDPLLFAGFVALWGAVAIPCAFALNANYMGILQAYIPFLESFRLRFGYAAYLSVYFIGVAAIGFLIIYGYRFLRVKLCKDARENGLYRR